MSLTANSDKPGPQLQSISFLKTANTMSHTLYDPFASGDESPTEEQNGLSNKPIEMDPRGASSHLGPGSSFSSSGTSSATPADSGGMLPSLPPQLMNYGPEQSRTITGSNMQSIPGFGGINCPAQDEPAAPNESRQPKGTSKSATDILLHFGLDEDDLDHLIFYPEDQITPANLPFILQEIRTGKTKRAASAGQTVPFAEPHPARSVSGMVSQSLSCSGGAGKSVPPASDFPSSTEAMHPIPVQVLPPFNRQPLAKVSPVFRDQPTATMLQDYHQATSSLCSSRGAGMSQKELSSVVLQLNKVTDYGYNSKYSEGVGDETASTSGSRADSGGSGSMSLMNTPNSSRHSRESVQKNVRELKRIVLGFPRDQTISVSTFSSSHSSILSSVDHSGNDWTTQLQTQPNQTSQSILLGCQSTLKTQPLPAVNLCVNPSQPGLVIVDKNDASVAKDHSEIKRQGSVAETIIKQQQKQPESLTGQTVCPPASPDSPNITDTMQPVPIQPPAKVSPFSKDVPIGLKLQDYAAATPRSFPHTCSLCNKECIHMKDWISHLNTSLHLENCQVLQKEAPGRRERGRREKRSSRSRSPHSSRCNRRSRSSSSSSGSCSSSPDRQSSQRRMDEKRSSPRRGNDRRSSPRSNSERRSPPWRSEKRRAPPWRSEKRRSPPWRSEKRLSPPWRSEKRRSPLWRSEKRRSPPWRSEKRRAPPRRSDERQSSPRRSEERQSSPRRSEERQSSPRRSDERQSSPRRSEERQSPISLNAFVPLGLQSQSTQSKLQNVAKLLAPAILAEITKMESSASSSSSTSLSSSFSSAAKKKKFTKKVLKAKPSLQTSEASSSTKAKCGKSSPPTMVKLQGIDSSVSLSDVLGAVGNYGKTKSCLLFRSTQGAVVCFEREEDAKKLKSINSFDVKDTTITVVKEQDTISKEQQRPLQNKPSMSSVFTSQVTPTTNVLLQTSGPGESTISEPITAGPSATATSDVVMKEEDEKPGTEATTDSTDGPEANEDVEKAEVKAEEGSPTTSIPNADVTSTSAISCENKVPAPASPAPSATISVTAKPAAVKSQTQPPPSELPENGSQPSLQTSGPGESTISEPITAEPSATATSDVVMKEDDEKPGTEATMDSTDGPEANKDVEKAEVKAEEGSITTFISSADVTSISAISCENKDPAPSQQTSGPGESTISEPITTGASVTMASDEAMEEDEGCLFDEQNFNMDNDEVRGVEDTFPEPHSSSLSKESSGEQREEQSSGLLSTGKGTSTDTSKDSETASYSSELTKGSRSSKSSSASPKTTESETKIGTSSAVHLPQQGHGLKPDSVKDKTARDESTVVTRSTRAKMERTTQQDASNEKTNTVGMSTRRSTRAGESQEQKKEKTPKKEEKTPPKRSTPSKKSDSVLREISKEGATGDVFDSMEDSVVPDDLPATRRKRGRPRKDARRTRKDKDAPEKLADEEATYQITDSVDDKLVGDQPPIRQSEEKNSENNDQQTKKSASLTAPTKNKKKGEPEAQVDRVVEDQERDVEMTERELQALVTLDPFVEREDGKTKESMPDSHPTSQPNTETSVTLDEPGDEEEKPQEEQTARNPKSVKRKHDDDTVGKPTREENVTAKDERKDKREPACTDVLPLTPLDASSSLDTDPSLLSSVSHLEIQKTEVEVEAVSQASAGQEVQPEHPENQTPEEGEEGMEGLSQADDKGYSEPVGPEAKRPRSQSPCAAASGGASSFQPNNNDLHCSIQSHSHDLQPWCPKTRIHLHDVTRKKLHDNDLADPNNWGKIAMIRPGRAPLHSPYLHMNAQTATEIKAQSKLVTCFAVETPHKPAAFSDARVTIYDHLEGPWAEVEEINKAEQPRLMAYLVAPPHDTHLVVPRGYYRKVTQPIQGRKEFKKAKGKRGRFR